MSYNTEFIWQADNVSDGIVAMSYLFKNKNDVWKPLSMYAFKKFENGIYYREAGVLTNKNILFSLAEISLPNGILRVDKCKSTDSVQVRLGHYALPEMKGAIKKTNRKLKGNDVCIIDNGEYQLAMVTLKGWNSMKAIDAEGINPVSKRSTVINVDDFFIPKQAKGNIYATLMLWKKSGERWTDKELLPVKNIKPSPKNNSVLVSFSDGNSKIVKFE